MLLHVGAFQTVMLPRLLDLLREKGFAIISLQEAQKDKAYETAPQRPGPRSGTFLGQVEVDPPTTPSRSRDIFATLSALCPDRADPGPKDQPQARAAHGPRVSLPAPDRRR